MKKFSFRNNNRNKSIQQTPSNIWDKCVVKIRTPNLPIHEFTSVISQLNSINFHHNQKIITQQDAFDLIYRISLQSQTSDVELCTNICRLCMTLFLKVHIKPQGEKLPTITRYFLNMVKNLSSYKAEPMKVLGQLLFTSGKHLSDLYDEIINLLLQYTTPTNPDLQLRETALMCCMTFTSHVSNYLNYTPIINTFLDVFKSFDYTSILSPDIAKMISHACLGFHSLAIQIQPKTESKDIYKVSRGVILREEIKAINGQLLPLVPEIIKYIIKYKYIYYDAEKIKQYNTAIEPNKSVLEKELQDAVRVRKHAAMCLQVLFPLEPLQLQTYWSDLLPYNNFLIVNTNTYSLLWLLKYDPVSDEFGQFIRLIQIIFTHLKLPILLMNFKVPTNIYASSKTGNIYYMILNVHKQLTELFTKNLNYKEIISPLLLCFKTFMEQKVPYDKIDVKKSLSGIKTNNYQHLMDILVTSYKAFDTNDSDVFSNAFFFWKIVYTSSEYSQIIIDIFLKDNSRYSIPNKLIERVKNWRIKSRNLNENLKKNEKKIVIRSIDHLAIIFKNYSSLIEGYFETVYNLLQINLFSTGDKELIPHAIGIVAAFYQSKENFSLYSIPENNKKTIKGSVIQLLGYIISSLGLVSSESRKAAVTVFNYFSISDYNNLTEANKKTLFNYLLVLIDDNDLEVKLLSFQTLSSLIQRVHPEIFYENIYTSLFSKLKLDAIISNERLFYCVNYTIGTLLIILKQTNSTNASYITHELYDILMKYKNIGSDIRCYIGLFYTSFIKKEERICLLENIISRINNNYPSKKLIIMLKDVYFLLSNMNEEEMNMYKTNLYKIFVQFNDIISKTKIIDIEIHCFKCLSLIKFNEVLQSEYGRICYLNCLLMLNKIYTLKPTEREKYEEKINSLLEILSVYTVDVVKHIIETDFNELSKDYLHILTEWINKLREEENSEEINDLDVFFQRVVALSS